MTKVKIRRADSVQAVPLGDWPIDKLDTLFAELKKWAGVYLADAGETTDDLAGQFVLTDTEFYFEIIVGLEQS